jgi:hypothetical protein
MYKLVYNVAFWVEPRYLDVWVPMHWDDDTSTQKLVSTSFYN